MEQNKCNKCGRPMVYATEPKCNYCDACMHEYNGCKLGRIKEMEPTCDSTAVIPSITVESVEGITNLANCLVHVSDINTTFYVDDKHRVMITWAGPVNIPGYDMENNPNGYRDQIVTDIEKGIAVIYDKNGKGYTFGIYDSLNSDGTITQAVNDKLDEMAADGTLTALIGAYCDPRLTAQDNKIEAQDEKINTLEIAVSADAYSKMNNIRKETYSVYKPVTLPEDFTEDIFTELEVYTNEEGNYIVNFDRSKYVNSGGNTYYISPTGNNSNDGSAEHPWLRLTTSVLNLMNSGDTVVIKSGIYDRDHAIYPTSAITKGINIISDGGKVVLSNYENTWVWTAYGNNTYHTTRSGVNAVFDIRDYQKSIIVPLTQLDSIESVDATPNSWCQAGNELYVHMKDGIMPSLQNMTTTLAANEARMIIQPINNNQKYYVKDIIILSSNQKCLVCDCAGNNNTRILIEDCDFYNTTRTTADAMSSLGCKTICKNVHCFNIEKDGFNYHEGTGVQAYGVEIDCSVNTCGRLFTPADYSNNATTAHDYCKAIRFNGVYNNCSGGVVIDVNNAVGACYNCIIADSFYHKTDAEASHDAKLYLYDCYFIGSKSDYNLFTYPDSNATIYVKDCEYQTYSGNVVTLT